MRRLASRACGYLWPCFRHLWSDHHGPHSPGGCKNPTSAEVGQVEWTRSRVAGPLLIQVAFASPWACSRWMRCHVLRAAVPGVSRDLRQITVTRLSPHHSQSGTRDDPHPPSYLLPLIESIAALTQACAYPTLWLSSSSSDKTHNRRRYSAPGGLSVQHGASPGRRVLQSGSLIDRRQLGIR